MNCFTSLIGPMVLITGLMGCNGTTDHDNPVAESHNREVAAADVPRGPHGGRLLVHGDFALELAIFETGVPPEFRVWITDAGTSVVPNEVDLQVTLTRLGNVKDEIGFTQQDDFLRGDTIVYEPHSFVVTVDAQYRGESYHWEYGNFEGRTRIAPEIADAFGLETELAGPATIQETVVLYGRVEPNSEQVRAVSARFDGVIETVNVSIGDNVRKGQTLAIIESNESLKDYPVLSPIDGIVTERLANPGEQTRGRRLFTIMDASSVWVELAVFPADLPRVRAGALATIHLATGEVHREGTVARLNTVAEVNQSVLVRVVLDNADGALVPGMYVTGKVEIAEHDVPLAVKRSGLQAFRDFTVVYAQIGDEYEVRMLDLGRQDAEWVEVLGGLDADTRYVTTNSYLIKADIEKTGASHDH